MDELLDNIARIAAKCNDAAEIFDKEPLKTKLVRLHDASKEVGKASSNSWLGYQSTVYIRGFRPRSAGEQFDTQWGLQGSFANATVGEWTTYEYDEVKDAIWSLARITQDEVEEIYEAAQDIKKAFEQCKTELVPILDAILSTYDDPAIRSRYDEIVKLKSRFTANDFISAIRPKGQVLTHDAVAVNGGHLPPHHIVFMAWLLEKESSATQARELAKVANSVILYLKHKYNLKGKHMAKTDGKIFIGHGHSQVWRDLKDFIVERLHLPYEEYSREPTAGTTTKERLEAMLDASCFAFLVMTAEDEHADATKHARENVVHEVGLFQGRLGFKRAIVLFEDGCTEFSNIVGLSQIRFPKGDIKSKFEELRRVLEREGIL